MKRMIALLLAAALCFSLLPTVSLGAAVPVQTDPIRKVDGNLLLEIADKPDDELVTVTLWLKGPAREEIEALVPMEKPGTDAPREERDAYQSEYAQVRAGVCSGIYDRFIDKYRDPETDQIVTSAYDDQPHLQMIVRKDRIPVFAAVDEVLWINRGESVYLQYDTPAAEKITDPLHEIMDKAAQDQQIPIRVWLRGMTGEEILPLVPVSFPTFTSTAAEIRAYLDASTQAWQSLTDDLFLYGQFTDNHREEFGEVLFQSKKIPVMAGTATAEKIRALAGLQMVRSIDPAVGFDEALPDPELPEDPAALKKIDSRLREFMTIATHDEMIPVSIDLKDPPAEEIDALIPSGSENDRLARNEASRQVYSTLNAGFVEDHLDGEDEVIFVSSYTSNVRATVPKHKIAGLAALDDVTSIVWIPFHDDPVYSDNTQVVPVPPRDSQLPVDPAVYDKLAPYLIEKLEDAPNSAKIPIDISLAAPSEEEILAQLDIPVPGAGATLEEVNAYSSAVRQAKKEVYSAITSAFVENYLDENDTVRVRGNYIPTLIVEVPKPKVFSLAALEEVTSIGWAGGYATVYPTGPGSSVPSEEPDYLNKIDPYLLGYIQNAANDELVRVEFELNALSRAEIEAQTGLTAPDLSSTMDEIRAWNRAVKEIYEPLFDAFYRKLDVDEEVEGDFIRNLTPVVWTVLPKGKALSLAALDEVQALNYYDEYTEGLPPPLRDKPVLQRLIEEAEDYLEEHSAAEFMPDAYSAFIETLDAARALIADEKASAYAVDSACSQLPSALSALKRAKLDVSAKLSSGLVEYMEGKADDAMIPIAVHLVRPSSAEIEAMVPIPQPDIYSTVTMEEVNAYITAKRAVGKEVFSGITGAFVQNYLDEKDKLRYRGLYTSTVICDVPKSKVLSLAALEDVTSIGYAPNGPVYPMWIRDEAEAAKKLTDPLKAHMENLMDEEPVTICVDLHMPSEEIMERLVSVPKPGEDASQEEIDAYNAAYQEKWKEQVALRTDAFVNHTLSGSEPVPVYYIGQDEATVICEVPVHRVKDLAFGQEITQIDLAGGQGETDKSALAKAILAAEALDLDQYTEESSAGLREQIEIANYILAKADATQEEIDAATKVLNEAFAGLVHDSTDEPPEYHAADSTEEILDWIRTERAKPREEWEDSWYHFLNDASKADKLLTAHPATEDCTLKEVMAISSSFGLDYFFLKDTDRIELAITPLNVTSDMTSEEALDDYMAQANRELSAQYEDWQFAKSTAKIGNTDIAFYFCDGGDYAQKDSDKKTLVGPTAFFAWQGHLVMIRGIDKLYGTKWDNDFFDLFRYELSDLSQPQFVDVSNPKAFYYDPVYWAFTADPQITNGLDKTHFGPDQGCTRGQVVTFLWRAAGEPEPRSVETAFTDVGPKAFYAKAVAWAVEQGITKGMSDDTFAPNATCTRGQIVTFLWRFRQSPAPKSTGTPFTDVGPKAFYAKAVAWAVENEITNGMTKTAFAPDATCTRGQVVTFLYRATAG